MNELPPPQVPPPPSVPPDHFFRNLMVVIVLAVAAFGGYKAYESVQDSNEFRDRQVEMYRQALNGD